MLHYFIKVIKLYICYFSIFSLVSTQVVKIGILMFNFEDMQF